VVSINIVYDFAIEFLYRQHIRRCDWKMFEVAKNFLMKFVEKEISLAGE
jgi:hypothetical protein